MMGSRTTIALALLAALLGAYIFLVDRRVPTTDERREAARRAVQFDPREVDGVDLSMGAVELAARRREGVWQLEKPVAAKARPEAIVELLDRLAGLPRVGLVPAAGPGGRLLSLKDYGLEQPRGQIRIGLGQRRLVIRLGANTPVGDGLFISVADHPDVLVVSTNLLSALPLKSVDWRDRRLFDGDASAIHRIEIQRAGGYLLLSRTAGEWLIQKPLLCRANSEAVDHWLGLLRSMQVADFVSDSDTAATLYGLDEPQAWVRLGFEDGGIDLGLKVGRDVPGSAGLVYAALEKTTHVYAVSNGMLDALRLPVELLRDRQLVPGRWGDLRRIEIRRGGDQVTLTSANGESWMVEAPVPFPADLAAVSELMAAWSGPRVLSFVDDASTNLPAYGLAPAQGSVVFDTVTQARTNGVAARIALGQSAGGVAYASLASSSTVVTVDQELFKVLRARPIDYRSRQVLRVPSADVTSVRWEAGSDRLDWERVGTNGASWNVAAGDVLDTTQKEAWIRAALGLRVAGWITDQPGDGRAFGLDQPAATFTIGLSGTTGLARMLEIGGPDGNGRVYATIHGQDVVFTLREEERDKLMEPLYKLRARNGNTDASDKAGPAQATPPVVPRSPAVP